MLKFLLQNIVVENKRNNNEKLVIEKKGRFRGNSQRYRISKLLEENITQNGSTGKSISNIVSLAHV